MKKFVILMLLAGMFAYAGRQVNLEPASAGDLIPTRLDQSVAKDVIEMPAPREAVSFSWALPADKTIELDAPVSEATSKEFWMTVRAADFNEGISLPITRGEALVRISPREKAIDAPALVDLVLVNRSGDSFSNGAGLEMLLDPSQVDAAKASPFGPGTAVFKIADQVGRGEVLLFADNMNYDTDATYLVQVRELNSDVSLKARNQRDTYLAGQTLRISADLIDGSNSLNAAVSGRLVSPQGQSWPLSFIDGVAELELPGAVGSNHQGLWEVQVTAEGTAKTGMVRRDVRTAFAVSAPTARFAGKVSLSDRGDMSADIAVQAAVAGRYEVRGLLFGHDADGVMVPVAVAHSARWLEVGEGSIELSFDGELPTDVGGPFLVKDLRLIHQNRMSLVQRQRDGFRFE